MTGASNPDSAENRTDAVAGESPGDAPRSPDEDTAPSEPEAQVSTRDDAFAYDASVPVVFSRPGEADGSVWNVQVAAPRDITDVVMAKNNSFVDAPPEGVRFVGFDVEMTLASAKTEPLRTGINFSWELLGGSTDAIYDSRTMADVVECRRAPSELGMFDEVFVGGTIAGVVCIPLPTEDLDSPDTAVAMNFDGDRVVFAINGARPDPAEVAQSRRGFIGRPLGYGSPVPVTLGGRGRSARSVWNVTVGAPRDVSDVFAQDNDFNDPALDGVTFLGFDVEMTLASAETETLAPGRNFAWEVLGGATSAVYGSATLGDLSGCGVIRGSFEKLSEVFVGGTLSGLMCIPVPTEDLNHPDTQIAMNLRPGRVVFFDGGPTPAPVAIEPGDGPSAVGPALPFGSLVALDSTMLDDDADPSTWSTTITNWRDMTAEVLAKDTYATPPGEGVIFVGFDVEITLIETQVEPLVSAYDFPWEILGASTNRVHTYSIYDCGSTPNEFNEFVKTFAGETLGGTVCIPLPLSDFADPDTRISLNVSGNRFIFTPAE